MASLNDETKKINLNLAVCDDPDGGEFDVIEMDLGWDRNILPICMLTTLQFFSTENKYLLV